MMNFETGLLQTFDHLKPFRPDRVNQDVNFVSLHEKRSVSDPGDADLAFADLRKLRRRVTASALYKKRRDQDAGEKIALVPVRSWTQSDAGGTLYRHPISRCLANNIPPAFFCETNRHNLTGYRAPPVK